ncbi:hypothetical protein AALB16_03395 [Lachnospiraceae bacterium 62-35]
MGRWRTVGAIAAVLAFMEIFPVCAGEWDKSEDGKHWMYFYSPGNPAEDEWIEENGKTYYVDSKGYMKTGWVTDSDTGNKYYMGEDGAKCFNMFTPDDRYVGPEGIRLERYDKYRKAVKSELKKNSGKSSGKKSGKKNAGNSQEQRHFLMWDLNKDGIRDLIIMDGPEGSGSLVEIAIWEPEEEKFQLSAEFDPPTQGEQRLLYLDPGGETIWLEIAEKGEKLNLFRMESDSAIFENVWNFTTEPDDWGGLEYYLNGDETEKDTWDEAMGEAKQERGSTPLIGYIPYTEENVKTQVDQILTGEELDRWE